MVFLVVMYRCESWTIKKAECQRIDAFKLWCWRRFLRVPWTARRSNQSNLKEINFLNQFIGRTDAEKLKLQYFGHLIRRPDSLKRPWSWERLRTGGAGGNTGWDAWMASLSQWTWVCTNSGSCEGQGSLVCCSPWGCKESDMTEATQHLWDAGEVVLNREQFAPQRYMATFGDISTVTTGGGTSKRGIIQGGC